MVQTASHTLRFQPEPWAAVVHLLLMAAAFVLFLGRKPGPFQFDALLTQPGGFYSHVFNFSLSYLFLAGVGFMWLMKGVAMRQVAWAALALAALNVVYELLLPWLNTRDPVDAAYGVVGTMSALAWLWLVQRCGLRPARGPGSGRATR